MTSEFLLRPATSILRAASGLALLATLVGCAGFTTTATPTPFPGAAIAGKVHGGQQPVSGSHIYLYAASTTGYGGNSTSLLKPGTGILQDATGNYYATTDSSGNFGFTNYNCPSPTSQVYLLALGGNPGLGGPVNNTAIAAIDVVGNCSSINTSSFFSMNEVTTAAFIFAAQQFMVSGTAVGSSSTNTAGLAIAFSLAQDLANPSNGVARTTNVAGTGIIPQAKLDTLGNVIAPCLNSASSASSSCTSLFSAVTPSGGTQPSNTVGALLLVAQNPGNNVANINSLASASPPFQPAANVTNDFTLAITYSGGGMTSPGNVVIDAAGDAYIGNAPSTAGASGTDSIVAFSPTGVVLTGATGFTTGIHKPNAVAIDTAGNIWSTDAKVGTTVPDQVVKLTSTGTVVFATSDAYISGPQGLAIDSANNAWVANQSSFALVKISPTGTDTTQVTDPNFYYPSGIGIDGTGNIFAAGSGSGNIIKFNSAGTKLGLYSPTNLTQPEGISVDASGNIWTVNNDSSLISVLSNTGAYIAPASPRPSLANAYVLSMDGAGGAWYANCRGACGSSTSSPDNLTHVLPSQAQGTGTADGYQDANLSRVGTSAIDATGNVWVTNNGSGTVTEFLGVASPVITPLAAGVAQNKLGVRP